MHYVLTCVLVLVIFSCAKVELLTVRQGGEVGFYDAHQRWTALHLGKNIKATQAYSSDHDDSVWILNAFNGLYRINDGKAQNMRSTFVSFTATHTHAFYGVTKKGKLYQCIKPCLHANQWTNSKLPSPPITAVDRVTDNSLGSSIKDRLKMEPLYSGKLIQIVSNKHALFGRDEVGNLWKYNFDTEQWQHIEIPSDRDKFVFKWICIVTAEDGDVLYVLNDEDQLPYKISLDTQQFELIHDANDFEQIAFHAGAVWALNYYKQLFYLNDVQNDWKYVSDNVHFISVGTIASSAAERTTGKTDL